MICPACEQYVFDEDPKECSHCHARVRLCKPCFGTGQLRAVADVASAHRQMIMIQCNDCQGHGLVRSD